jgi:excisionase family DNA binding protein
MTLVFDDENPTESTPNPADPPKLVNAKEAGRMLGISDKYIRALVERGDLESVQVGSRRMVPIACINAYAARLFNVTRAEVPWH